MAQEISFGTALGVGLVVTAASLVLQRVLSKNAATGKGLSLPLGVDQKIGRAHV